MTGLVLEGGSFRGVFTAGVLDYLQEQNIEFPYVNGVSSGAGNAMNFLSGQVGRCLKVISHENADPYYGLGQIRESAKYLDLDKMLTYDQPEFDYTAFFQNEAKSEYVAVNCETGKPEYFSIENDKEKLLSVCKASCSVALVCQPVSIDGSKYLDGSIVDSIPFERALEQGCDKLVVILTRKDGDFPTDYSKMRLIINTCYKNTYPKVAEAMMVRSIEYAKQMSKLMKLQQAGKALIIRPEIDSIGHFENKTDKIRSYYEHGRELAARDIDKIKEFIS